MDTALLALEGCPIAQGDGHRAGLALLEALYGRHIGGPMPPICRTDRGKPYFDRGAVHFSISHTQTHVFCALAHVPVGLDAERTDRAVKLSIAPGIFSAGEMARLEAAPDRRAAFLRLWVLKEAQAKCTGQGIGWHPRHTDFDPADPRVREFCGHYVAVITEEENAI